GLRPDMNRKRVVRVTASTIALAIGVYLLVVFANKDQGTTQETYRRISALEDRARHRFAESRGLTPCGNDERRWLSAAERKLALAGYPSPRVIVVAAPTFSDISLLAIGDAALDRYTFPEQTAFGPEFL